MEEKTEWLEAQTSMLRAMRINEDFFDRSHEKLALDRPKGKKKWQHVTTRRKKRN